MNTYEGLVVDLWGVMHNGKTLFPNALAALKAAKSAGKSVTLLSNAPRRRTAALAALDRLGLTSDLFDNLVTSGEIAWQAIRNGKVKELGPKCYFFGSAQDQNIKDGLTQVHFVDKLDLADWVLNVGPESGHCDLSPFQGLIDAFVDRNLPMVCANPDLVVQRGLQKEICAGAVAEAYEQRGGHVLWFGKPHGAVYEAVYASCGLEPSQLLAVGDSFKTDIRGANAQNMDVLYVNTGIHRTEIKVPMRLDVIAHLSKENDAIPSFIAEVLRP